MHMACTWWGDDYLLLTYLLSAYLLLTTYLVGSVVRLSCTWHAPGGAMLWEDDTYYYLLTTDYLVLTTYLVGSVVRRQAVLREDDDVAMVSQLLP